MGRHRDHPRKRQNRGAPSRPSGERDLHRQGPCTHALGRPSRVHGGGRVGRLHLRALLRSAPGDQRQPDRGTGVRAVPQRWRGGRGEPGHRACRKAGAGAVDRSHASQRRHLGNKTSRAINPIRDTAKIPEAGDEGGGGGGGDSEDSSSDGGDSNLDLS